MTSPIPPQVSLRALREAQGLTLAELADLIREQGVEISTDGLNNAELGHRGASEKLMLAWASALNVKRMHIRSSQQLRDWLTADQEPQPVAA